MDFTPDAMRSASPDICRSAMLAAAQEARDVLAVYPAPVDSHAQVVRHDALRLADHAEYNANRHMTPGLSDAQQLETWQIRAYAVLRLRDQVRETVATRATTLIGWF